MRTTRLVVAIALFAAVGLAQPRSDTALQRLGDDIFAWRLEHQPFTCDDVDQLW